MKEDAMDQEKRFEYTGPRFADPGIAPCRYLSKHFRQQVELESDGFYEIRKSNGIEPHRLSDSSSEQLEGIAAYFDDNAGSFFQLFHGEALVGSILLLGNYIQCLAVARDWQRKGYGKRLAAFAVNRILDEGYSSVVLHTLPGNGAAEALFAGLGFREAPGLSRRDENLAAHFDRMYEALENCPLVMKIFTEVYGTLAPDARVVRFSFPTHRDLGECAEALHLLPGARLLDLACGRGGPGLWIARATQAKLTGMDLSRSALRQATEVAASFALTEAPKFKRGSMTFTGLESESFDGVVSIDGLFMAADRRLAFAEIGRILRPRARLVFTTYQDKFPGAVAFPTEQEHRSLLENAGFKIEKVQETEEWERLHRGVYVRWIQQNDELAAQMGTRVAGFLAGEARHSTVKLDDGTDRLSRMHRVLFVCRRSQ
jgi:ubiquinone/menaquinone biosynthesis C-methylase UbiE/ribosomal protein S18 acetylase RimI-like enzyme